MSVRLRDSGWVTASRTEAGPVGGFCNQPVNGVFRQQCQIWRRSLQTKEAEKTGLTADLPSVPNAFISKPVGKKG